MQNTSHAVMAQRTEAKDSLDDFPTPPWATRALIEHVLRSKEPLNQQSSLEPACGADSGKKRSILRDTLCTQILLQSYGQLFDLQISAAHSFVVFYYGMCSINKPFSLTKEELNEHFDFPVTSQVDLVNAYFERRLFALLDEDA
jgi:hypothetical protein